ncbi:NUDIX domain-containing protein [Halosimplex sp. J119]
MSVAEGSRDRVESRLVTLQEDYDGFPVNQTTLAVSREAYERASERCDRGIVDSYVQLYNERDDVLLVDDDGDWVVPHGEPRPSERVTAGTERAVRDRTGIDCSLTDLSRVTILGVRDESDPDRPPVYRLIAVFTAETDTEAVAVDGGEAGEAVPDDVRWQSTLPESAVPSH